MGSDEWVDALASRAARASVDPAVHVVVQQELLDTGARWHVVVAGGQVVVAGGGHPEPDVTFAQDLATAAAIRAGELSAQQAFMDGRLRVRGDMKRLVAATEALAAIGG